MTATIVSAADAGYFDLLKGLVCSIRDKDEGKYIALSILDVGLDSDHRHWLADRGATIVEPGWDFDIPASMNAPAHFRALLARLRLAPRRHRHDDGLQRGRDARTNPFECAHPGSGSPGSSGRRYQRFLAGPCHGIRPSSPGA